MATKNVSRHYLNVPWRAKFLLIENHCSRVGLGAVLVRAKIISCMGYKVLREMDLTRSAGV